MEAPRWPGGRLIYERIRCLCTEENLLVYPDLWYPGQEVLDREPLCCSCGRGLLPQLLPMGAVEQVFPLAQVPAEVLARLVDPQLSKELSNHPSRAPLPYEEADWDARHAAPAAYVEWLERNPPAAEARSWRPWVLVAVLVLGFLAMLWASTW